MSEEAKRSSAEEIGALGSCLIDGDSEQISRERKIKRRALGISIGLQSLVLVALVVTPLLAKPEKLALNIVTPIPPYRAVPNRPAQPQHSTPQHASRPNQYAYAPSTIPPHISLHDDPRPDGGQSGPESPDLNGFVPVPGGTETFTGHKAPATPEDPNRNGTKRVTKGGDVQAAMLVRRVDPCYPPLARQLRRSGQVRLHAVISTDGSVESLQLMDGDPLFVQCAMDAVRQWRYRPTTLNGSPVEVETVVTVVYTLNQ